MTDHVSKDLFSRAQRVIPGGVNSPVRAFKAVGDDPVFIESAEGAHLVGADGTKYIDYVGSWGPMIVGHTHPQVVQAVQAAAEKGTSFGAPTQGEIELAEMIVEAYPSMDMVRMTSSGTEAVMGALRAARGFTGRDLIVKFEGCYHGGADYLLVKAGSGMATFGEPDSAGVPASIASTTAILPFNDLQAVEAFFAARGREVAAVILEPVVGNMGCVPPRPGFLEGLRRVTEHAGALLVFDEVMTGFRLAYGGAQERFGVTADLTTLGKIVGGGLPVGAYGGRRDIMQQVSPVGPVYQAGTLSGNPLAVAAGKATLRLLRAEGVYEQLESRAARLADGLSHAAVRHGIPMTVQRVGSMLTPYFNPSAVTRFEEAGASDMGAFAVFHARMLRSGVYWPPSQYEAGFVSLAHDDGLIDRTIEAATEAFKAM